MIGVHVATVRDIAIAIPANIARIARAYRHEFTRRLQLRGWSVRHLVHLEPGSRGDDTYRCGAIDLLCTPPAPPIPDGDTGELPPPSYPPVLVQIERHTISYRTRAKLASWGQRPHSGRLVVMLYAAEPDPIPEADVVLALGHARRKVPTAEIREAAETRRFSHAVGVNEARYQRHREASMLQRRAAGGRAGMRARKKAREGARAACEDGDG